MTTAKESLRRLARGLGRMPLALEAAGFLTLSSLVVRAAQGGRLLRLLGVCEAPVPPATGRSEPEAGLVGRAVARVAARLPWHPTCLPRALATRWMLRRRGIPCETHLGVVNMTPFQAHAWVTVRGVVVQGGPVGEITTLARIS